MNNKNNTSKLTKQDKNILRQIENWTGHEDVRYEIYKFIVGILIWFAVIATFIISFAIWFSQF